MKTIKGIAVLTSLLFSISTLTAQSEIYVAKYKDDANCAISYTFDDGLVEHYTLVAPELEKQGFRGTFWVWGKCIGIDSLAQGKPRMTWEQMKEMADKGHEISNHSWSHPNLKRISLEEVKVEVERNDSIIFANLGKMPRSFCYPFNAFDSKVLEIAAKNRVGTRTVQYRMGSSSTPESLDQWVSELIEKGEWGVTMIHGVSYGYDAFKDPLVFWSHVAKVKGMPAKAWVGTFSEVAAYMEESKNVRLDIAKDGNSFTITPSLPLDKELYTEPLTMVVKKEGVRNIAAKQDNKELPVKVGADKITFSFDPYGGAIQVNLK